MKIPVITLAMEGATIEQAQHYQKLIHTLFAQGVFSVRRGSAILHFDEMGILQEIEIHQKKWKHNRESPASQALPVPKVEIA